MLLLFFRARICGQRLSLRSLSPLYQSDFHLKDEYARVAADPGPWPDHGHLPAPPFRTVTGVCREEAINLLRRFYMQENPHAPDSKKKTRRELKLLALPGKGSSTAGQAASATAVDNEDTATNGE